MISLLSKPFSFSEKTPQTVKQLLWLFVPKSCKVNGEFSLPLKNTFVLSTSNMSGETSALSPSAMEDETTITTQEQWPKSITVSTHEVQVCSSS